MPRFTAKMHMHLNGGSDYSELHYKVLRDGQETQITRHTRTSGHPGYLKTHDFFQCDDAVFDLLESKGVGLIAWLEEHSKVPCVQDESAETGSETES